MPTIDHPGAPGLMEAAQSDRPLRTLAAAVTEAEFNVPPFIFIQAAEGLQGIVCGAIRLEVNDTEMSLVDGASADPWAHLRISESACSVERCPHRGRPVGGVGRSAGGRVLLVALYRSGDSSGDAGQCSLRGAAGRDLAKRAGVTRR